MRRIPTNTIKLSMAWVAENSELPIGYVKKMVQELNNAGKRPTNVQKLLRLQVITSSLDLNDKFACYLTKITLK